MDVVGSWSVGSSSMRWRIGTSDTVVKALPSVRVRIWRVRIWRVRIWRVRIWRVHLKSSFEEFIWRVHLRVIGCLWVCFKNRKSSDACQWCDEREFIWTRVHLNESSFGQTGKKKTETRNETGQKSSSEEFIWRVHLKSFYLKSFYLKSFYLKSFLFEEFNNVNGGMDVVGSWSVGSSSMRWRIGTSDTVVKALPSVRVRIWRVRIWRVRI